VLLNQVPSKTIDVRFTPIRKIIKRASNGDKDVKKVVASVSDILLKELEGIVRLSINKI
jgi:hypothetical protein